MRGHAGIADGPTALHQRFGAAAGIRANINRAYAAVASPTDYDPGAFRNALRLAVRDIEALR